MSFLSMARADESAASPLNATVLEIGLALKEHEFVVVECFAAWCTHCKKFKSTVRDVWGELQQNEEHCPLYAIDADKRVFGHAGSNSEISIPQGEADKAIYDGLRGFLAGEIRSFPTILKLTRRGDTYTVVGTLKRRSKQDLLAFCGVETPRLRRRGWMGRIIGK